MPSCSTCFWSLACFDSGTYALVGKSRRTTCTDCYKHGKKDYVGMLSLKSYALAAKAGMRMDEAKTKMETHMALQEDYDELPF